MARYTCDVCKLPITEVVYIIAAHSADNEMMVAGKYHLHFKCIEKWGK